ncbi:MAG: fused MFS/spermidine synthase [Propionibacteriaceae bacterium]|nr:fused MFS/spermidine synthase [Propionibacteriaceae bacterium]
MTDPRLVPDRERPGAWIVRVGGTDQSYVDPDDPTWLEFDYVQRLAAVVDGVAAPGRRIRAVHVGGAGLTLPRYIAATRPTSSQIVFEPDVTLTAAVRAVVPLPPRSGIKVRPLDGRSGFAGLREDSADLVIVDAFAGASVPGELVTREWLAEVRRVVGAAGTVALNLTDHAPFGWSRRVVAGVVEQFGGPGSEVTLAAESATLKGRRFGNLIVAAGPSLDVAVLTRRAAAAAFPYRVLSGAELARWLGGAKPFTDADQAPSPPPPEGPTVFR